LKSVISQYPQINPDRIPKHVAVIMDGNGRWAKKLGRLRIFGHKQGVNAVRTCVEIASELGVEYLTVYAFSTENWNRPAMEVNALMQLLVDSVEKELPELMKNNVRLKTLGNMEQLPKNARLKLQNTEEKTANNTGTTLILALSYSSRWDMIQAVKKIAEDAKNGLINPSEISERTISEALNTSKFPDPDLLIRTSGEHRISNFLLWEIAYSELYFTPVLWPDFTKQHFIEALLDYQSRERRFGKTSEQIVEVKK
jgi:undecaprenyl diphosphate synthase